ncbi:PREDICTED: myrosinase 1-like [Papilio xuthus]|uniref:beta-glucosidase n=2 Tax=Papilio xuthus TaxID=66420 RepID=A0AAJ6Z5K6_PAPXU|nr:PREDICTED: myrosinase 1-like [Papilio xuthus]
MVASRAVVFCTLASLVCGEIRKFPPGFKWGAATSSYQIEGGWNVSDKGENIWDRFVHDNPDAITDGSNGDVACDSYHNWQEDVRISAELGLDFYRFSMSWPRLLPTGTSERISEDGKAYYNNLINGLLEKGIQPVVTLYHWDLPQRLQDLGGWANPYIVDWFADYARIAYKLFGDRVKTWVTINEPIVVCDVAYNTGQFAPGIKDPEFASYLCNKNILLAHAKAWRIYDEEFKPKYHGKAGITNQLFWIEGASNEYDDLAELVRQYMAGMYSHAIYTKEGGWPPQIEKLIAEKSKKEGHQRSRLPPFTKDEIEFIKGTYDFYGFNYYTSRQVRKSRPGDVIGSWPLGSGAVELDAAFEIHPTWKKTDTFWFWINAPGFRNMMKWIKNNYGDIEILVTENGLAIGQVGLNDVDRVKYYRDHLEQMWLTINEDGVNVTGYTAWSLMDNFEWTDGYITKFGLYEVDFTDPKRPRTPRASAKYYKDVIRSHSYDVSDKYMKEEL